MIRSRLKQIARGVGGLWWSAAAGCLGLSAVTAGCRRLPPIDADLIVVDVTVIDGTDSPPANHRSVAIKGDPIVAVGPAAELKVTPSAVVVDGRGKYLVPGLWDMHVHLYGYHEAAFPLFLANGVTSIREMGGDLNRLLALRARLTAGTLIGAGPVDRGADVGRALCRRGLSDHADWFGYPQRRRKLTGRILGW